MRALEVKDILSVGKNTLIAVADKCSDIKNGSALLDANGKPYEILSIATNSNKNGITTTNILVEGQFKSNKIYL